MLRLGRRRYFDNDGSLRAFDAPTEIRVQLEALVTRYPPKVSTFEADKSPVKAFGKREDPDLVGLYTGPTSIAYGLHLFDDEINGRGCMEWAEDYLAIAEQMQDLVDPRVESMNGIANERLARYAVTAVIRGSRPSVQELLAAVPRVVEEVDGKDEEWLSGRAGFLYLLRVVRVRRPEFAEDIKPAEQEVIEALMRHGPGSKEIWPFRGSLYFGLSHGWTGIVNHILLSDPSRFPQLKSFILDIISKQQKDGSWLLFNDDKRHKEMPIQSVPFYQLSHGSPGVVLCLMSVRDACDKETREKIDWAVERAQVGIWEYGNLTKESCQLHGAAGNSLVLLDKRRKETFLHYSRLEWLDAGIKDGRIEASEPGSGLSKGIVGRVWAMKEYQRGRHGVFLGYNDV